MLKVVVLSDFGSLIYHIIPHTTQDHFTCLTLKKIVIETYIIVF